MKIIKMMSWTFILALLMVVLNGCTTTTEAKTETIVEPDNWKTAINDELPELGHRNWIVIADAAYPAQNSDGITTIVTGEDQTTVLKHVLEEIDAAKHVKPIIMVDKELDYILEKDAAGVDAYKAELNKLVSGKDVSNLPHMDIIEKLDEGSQLFNIVILKTEMTIPYTSVFINLDCAYWSAEKEDNLRSKMAAETTETE